MRIPAIFRDLAQDAKEQGWTITRLKSGHLRWESPDSKIVISPHTPCKGQRSRLNLRADLKRAGLNIREGH